MYFVLDNEPDPEPDNFVPVDGITGVPSHAVTGTDLTLTGTVFPSNATNKAIIWSVSDPGTTGARITGNALATTGSGTVTVTATIADGTAEGTPYTETFTIIIDATTLGNISVSGPSKTTYNEGDALDLTGLIVTATYSNGTSHAVTSYTVSPAAGTILSTGTQTVTVTYMEGSITKTANFTLTVNDLADQYLPKYYQTDVILERGEKFESKIVGGESIDLLYHIGTIKEYPITQLTPSYPGGVDITYTSGWSTTSGTVFTETISKSVSHTTGINWTLSPDISFKSISINLGGVEWVNETTRSEEYTTSFSTEISKTKTFEVTVNTKDWDPALFYRVAVVTPECKIYQHIHIDKESKQETVSYIIDLGPSHLYYPTIQHNTSTDFTDLTALGSNNYGITDYNKNLTAADWIVTGKGTSESPYRIYDAADLRKIGNNMTAHYKLVNDIPLSGTWMPLGDSGSGNHVLFTGTLDGGGKKISGLTISMMPHQQDSHARVGLFAIIGSGGKVSNLTLENVNITATMPSGGTMSVGGIAGWCTSGEIEKCSISGVIVTIDDKENSIVSVGGVVGRSIGSTIKGCVNSAVITAQGHSADAGGIVGFVGNGVTDISYCVNSSSIKADAGDNASAGGIVGYGSSGLSINHCVNAGRIDANAVQHLFDWIAYTYAGGIVGYVVGNMDNTCYYLSGCINEAGSAHSNGGQDRGVDGENVTDNATAKTLASLRNKSTYLGWDGTVLEYIDGSLPTIKK